MSAACSWRPGQGQQQRSCWLRPSPGPNGPWRRQLQAADAACTRTPSWHPEGASWPVLAPGRRQDAPGLQAGQLQDLAFGQRRA
eukprot:NODE_5058_length_736_cov_11.195051_g4243_i0.p5 GENE.NODE_5058_length_736_cov_11.195051_g4243_i0~~NODE_5058_length_736_cov_11.195051_g4243_i0.p5  ORF type:complete len:84 (-),score=0.41 NODE_5058_length_736_cov_11.195051_g4243_i0:333-584(-)